MKLMNIFPLKTTPEVFNQILRGVRRFDIRRKVERVRTGDIIHFREYYSEDVGYTGMVIVAYVESIFEEEANIEAGYFIATFQVLDVTTGEALGY